MFLNNCLTKAVRLSVNADDKYADNVSFMYKYVPRVIDQSSPDVFDCIQLHYKVGYKIQNNTPNVVVKTFLFQGAAMFVDFLAKSLTV